VYHHSKGEELLAAAVYMEGLKDYQEGMIATLEQDPGAREGLYGMVGYHPGWAKFLINMRHADCMWDTETLIELSNQEFISVVGEFLTRHMEAGNLQCLRRDVCLSLIFWDLVRNLPGFGYRE
jgi:hypothetical protein